MCFIIVPLQQLDGGRIFEKILHSCISEQLAACGMFRVESHKVQKRLLNDIMFSVQSHSVRVSLFPHEK